MESRPSFSGHSDSARGGQALAFSLRSGGQQCDLWGSPPRDPAEWGSQPLSLGPSALRAPEWLGLGVRAQGLTSVAHCLQVPELVTVLRSKLQDTQEEDILQAAQRSVYLLASQHCAAVVASLLGSPLPFDRYVAPARLRGAWGPTAGLQAKAQLRNWT